MMAYNIMALFKHQVLQSNDHLSTLSANFSSSFDIKPHHTVLCLTF
ncbi:MAG: hypothetical protein JXQ76_03765 [Campylobacterales bacterium]|nr:hypothetical protein [Campylobacterales bacterium]